MKKCLLSLLAVTLWLGVQAQTVVLDWEDPATSTDFQFFGGSLEGQISQSVANPNPTGINTSDNVLEFLKAADSPVWGGAFSNPDPTVALDMVANGQICLKVHTDHETPMAVKLENASNGVANWITAQTVTTLNEWVEVCFDVSLPSIEDPFTPGTGGLYSRLVIFMDWQVEGTAYTYYIDDVVLNPAGGGGDPTCETKLDWEDAATSTDFQFFGGDLEGQISQSIANPNPTGINTSDNVLEFLKAANSPVWGGAFSNPDVAGGWDMVTNNQICMKVHTDHETPVAVKLENSTNGVANWITTQTVTTLNEWVEICFDVADPSIEDPFTPGTGGQYERIVIFMDWQVEGTAYTYYIDDIAQCSSGGGAQDAEVTFVLDMNEITDPFTLPHVSGTFNGWSGDANPMSDMDGDGVWEATLTIPVGVHEFKFTADNWTIQEEFSGLDECTVTDGPYTNRSLVVTGDATVGTYCWNSCYACGEGRMLTFELGFDGENNVPSPDGVWLAGGGNFDNPGGRFQMFDDDGDGVYTITMERGVGFESFYTFANGNCPDYSCKEDISGQDCANPNNYNDRLLPAISDDTVISTCFAICTEDTNCAIDNTTEIAQSDLFELSPSPVTTEALIRFNTTLNKEGMLQIVNLNGQLISSRVIAPFTDALTLDMNDLSAGMYLVQLTVDNQVYTEKIIKQ